MTPKERSIIEERLSRLDDDANLVDIEVFLAELDSKDDD
jgi:hypothetical protein